MPQAFCRITIQASAHATWQVVRDFGAGGQYLSGVQASQLSGEGVGALRTLTGPDGSTITERLETLSEADREISYLLMTDTPFGKCLTTLVVRDLGPNQSELEWSVTFEPDGIPVTEAVEILEGVAVTNCIALKQFMER